MSKGAIALSIFSIVFCILPAEAVTVPTSVEDRSFNQVVQLVDPVIRQLSRDEVRLFKDYLYYFPDDQAAPGLKRVIFTGPQDHCKQPESLEPTGQGYVAVAEIGVVILQDTPTRKNFRIHHRHCEHEDIIVEKINILGKQMPPLEWHKFLLEGHQYAVNLDDSQHEKTVEWELRGFSRYITVFKTKFSRKTPDQVNSEVHIQGELILSQVRNFKKKRSTIHFKSPLLSPFDLSKISTVTQEINKNHRICFEDNLLFVWDAKGLRIGTENVAFSNGLDYVQFDQFCLPTENKSYGDLVKSFVSQYFNFYLPKAPAISTLGSVSDNDELIETFEQLIRDVDADRKSLTLETLRELLEFIEDGDIVDQR